MITVRFGGLLHSCHTTFWAQDGQHALPGAPNVQEGPDGLDVNRSWVDAGLLARPAAPPAPCTAGKAPTLPMMTERLRKCLNS